MVISIWSLLHTKHPRNDIITNRSICRQYTEVYEDVRQSAKSQGPRVVRLHSMKRTVRQHDKMDNGIYYTILFILQLSAIFL